MKQEEQIEIKFEFLEDAEDRWGHVFDVLERLAAEMQQKVETNDKNN
jgi:hypothetical protein